MMQPRKSQLFLHGVFPVKNSHDDVVKKKLKPGKFLFTLPGMLKVLGAMFLLAAVTFFLAADVCIDQDNWRRYLFIIINVITLVISLMLYMVFVMGYAVKKPWIWVKIDIILNTIPPMIAVICAPIATEVCSKTSQLKMLPMPFGVTGNVLLIFSSAAIFLLYRYKEEEEEVVQPRPQQRPKELPRRSIFA